MRKINHLPSYPLALGARVILPLEGPSFLPSPPVARGVDVSPAGPEEFLPQDFFVERKRRNGPKSGGEVTCLHENPGCLFQFTFWGGGPKECVAILLPCICRENRSLGPPSLPKSNFTLLLHHLQILADLH